MIGAGIIFWKKVDGKKFVLLGKRSCGYGKNHFSNFGGHQEKSDEKIFLNTAIRESAEETGIIPNYGNQIQKAKDFFSNPDFHLNPKPIRKTFFIYDSFRHHTFRHYTFHTFECEVTGEMSEKKWFSNCTEHYKETVGWYPISKFPKPLLFAARLNILHILFHK